MTTEESPIVGIDLGTTNSLVAYTKQGKASVLENELGQRITPSVVAYTEDGTILVGQEAKRQAVVNPKNTFSSFKRYLGRTKAEMEGFEGGKNVAHALAANEQGGVAFYVPAIQKQVAPEELSAHLLRKLIKDAQQQLGDHLQKAVITVPAYFSNIQRTSVVNAGKIAGIEVVRIVSEPTAGVLGYITQCEGMQEIESVCRTLAVFDLGGGTFDVAIVESDIGVVEVRTSCGDSQLGGDDFDQVIFDWIAKELARETGFEINSSSDFSLVQRVAKAAESAKIELSTLQKTRIRIPFLASISESDVSNTGKSAQSPPSNGQNPDPDAPKPPPAEAPATDSPATTDSSGQDGNPKPEQGTSNPSPAPSKTIHCDLTLTREEFKTQTQHLLDRCTTALDQAMRDAKLEITDIDSVVLVGGSTRIPSVQELASSYFDREITLVANPDELVGLGASVQAGVLGGETSGVVLIDVTPLTLGIEVYGGATAPIIKRNTKIPVTKSQLFSPAQRGQRAAEIHVLQGERLKVSDNISLGKFTLELPNSENSSPGDQRGIRVEFCIDANGLLVVSALDKTTNLQASLEFVNPAGSLDEATIERLIRTANAKEAEDAIQRGKIESQQESFALRTRIEVLLENTIPCPGDPQYSTDPDSLSARLTATQETLKQYFKRLDQAYLDLDYDSMAQLNSDPDLKAQLAQFEQLLSELRSA